MRQPPLSTRSIAQDVALFLNQAYRNGCSQEVCVLTCPSRIASLGCSYSQLECSCVAYIRTTRRWEGNCSFASVADLAAGCDGTCPSTHGLNRETKHVGGIDRSWLA
eukprot:5010457-Amphidinium_carterae.1